MIEKIEWNGKIFALILYREFNENGINFITSKENPLQVGTLIHKKGTEIKAHVHKLSTRKIDSVQEVLHIEYGKIQADIFNDTGEKIKSCILNEGDTILLLNGGHGFRILENAKIIEIKQGPYYGVDGDKEYLEVQE